VLLLLLLFVVLALLTSAGPQRLRLLHFLAEQW
jgi:hypothetical protein